MVYEKKKKRKKNAFKKKMVYEKKGEKRGSHTGVEIYIWYGLRVIAPQ